MGLVWEWWELHKAELDGCWKRVVEEHQDPTRIEPLE
jgi:hypothetical protein